MRGYKSENLSGKMLILSKDLISNVNLINIYYLCKITTKNDNNFHSSGYVDKCFFDYDAAMITLPKAFDFASNVNAACLPNKKIVPSR